MSSPSDEPWTPVRVERELTSLTNSLIKADQDLRKLLIQEAEAQMAYEHAHVIAATDPNCPIPTRGGATVGERESWIRGVCEDEFQGLEYAKLNVTIQKNYMRTLEQRVSIAQTMARMVALEYQVVGRS